MTKNEIAELALRLDLTIIPYHKHNYVDRNGTKRGQSPLDTSWITKTYPQSLEYINEIMSEANVGVRLKPNQICIDLDPRHFKEGQTIKSTCQLLDIDELTTLSVISGQSGRHLYYKLPNGVSFKDLKSKIETDQIGGVDVKKFGGAMCFPPSKHRITKTNYKILNVVDELPELPNKVLQLIKKTSKFDDANDQEFYRIVPPSVIGEILSHLDVRQFSDRNDWFKIACACSHASGGEAFEEFNNWSISHPDYAHCSAQNKQQWDTIENDRQQNITIRSLIQELRKRNVDCDFIFEHYYYSKLFNNDSDSDSRELQNVEIYNNIGSIEHRIRKASAMFNLSDLKLHIYKDLNIEPALVNLEALEVLIGQIGSSSNSDTILLIKKIALHANAMDSDYSIYLKNKIKAIVDPNLKANVEAAFKINIFNNLIDRIADFINNKAFNKGDLIKSSSDNQVLIYNGVRWIDCTTNYVESKIRRFFDMNKDCLNFVRAHNPKYTIYSLSKLVAETIIQRERDLIVNMQTVDDPDLAACINLANGTLEVHANTGEIVMREHRPSDYFREISPLKYQPELENERSEILEIVRGMFKSHPDSKKVFERAMDTIAFTMLDRKPEPIFTLLIGESAGNGKSTFIRILRNLHQNSIMPAMYSNVAKFSNAESNKIGELLDIKLITIEEVPSNKSLDNTLLKDLAGGVDTYFSGSKKFKDTVNFRYRGTIVLASNSYPTISENDRGVRRRLNVLPFIENFSVKRSSNVDLSAINDPIEQSKFLFHVVKHMSRIIKRYNESEKLLTYSKSCENNLNRWLQESSEIEMFLLDRIEITDENEDQINCKDMYVAFKNYCKDDLGKKYALSQHRFTREMKSATNKDTRRIAKGNIWVGFKFKEYQL